MLVSATEMLNKAKAGHYAVGQFNINNLEWTKAILQTAQELNRSRCSASGSRLIRRLLQVSGSWLLFHHVRWLSLSDRRER